MEGIDTGDRVLEWNYLGFEITGTEIRLATLLGRPQLVVGT
jgi:hypothetical protein